MDLSQDLDPRVKGFEKKVKVIGVGLVAVAAAAVVAVTGGAIIVASLAVIGALVLVNVVPVVARRMAIWKQSKLTAIAEEFSEETIREDERQEGERVAEQQRLYATQSAEFSNIIDELYSNMASATPEEQKLLQGQIDQLNGVIKDAETAVQNKVADLVELKRVNKMYVGFHRAGKALKSSQDLARNAQQIQQVETARNAIKTRMREALAGQKLDAMNAPLRERLSVSHVAQIASSPVDTIQPVAIDVKAKEVVNVSRNR